MIDLTNEESILFLCFPIGLSIYQEVTTWQENGKPWMVTMQPLMHPMHIRM